MSGGHAPTLPPSEGELKTRVMESGYADPRPTNRARQRRNEAPPDPTSEFHVEPRTGTSPEPRVDDLKNEVKDEVVDETMQRVREEMSQLGR